MQTTPHLKRLGLIGSFSIYIPAALPMYCMTSYLIPYLRTGQETIPFWFIVAGLGIFLPLIITGVVLLKLEGYRLSGKTWIERLQFRSLTKIDVAWGFLGLLSAGILSGLIMKLLELTVGKFDHSPAFMSFEPLSEGRFGCCWFGRPIGF